jgi:hypothetical protein
MLLNLHKTRSIDCEETLIKKKEKNIRKTKLVLIKA